MDIKFQGTGVAFQDTHHPFHDQRAIHEVELFITELQPGLILLPGDLSDFYDLSKFDKNPKRENKLQSELDMTANMLKRLRVSVPNARIIVEDGNHEDRLRRYLWSKGKGVASLRGNTIEALYGLADSGVEHVEYEEGIKINKKLLVTHSDMVRAESGYTARGLLEKHGCSGISGHSHRLGTHYKTKRGSMFGWWENGCLCDLNPEYKKNPNWQQGFSVIEFSKERFWVQPIQVINGKFMFGSKIYGSGGKKRG